MTDLQELFSRDPLNLSRQDREAIIAELRKMRNNFNSAQVAATIKPRGKAATTPSILSGKIEL